jgi:hypothetical protein
VRLRQAGQVGLRVLPLLGERAGVRGNFLALSALGLLFPPLSCPLQHISFLGRPWQSVLVRNITAPRQPATTISRRFWTRRRGSGRGGQRPGHHRLESSPLAHLRSLRFLLLTTALCHVEFADRLFALKAFRAKPIPDTARSLDLPPHGPALQAASGAPTLANCRNFIQTNMYAYHEYLLRPPYHRP